MNVSKKLCIIVLLANLFSATFVQESLAYDALTPYPKQIEYRLPYPGLLPDHPLYFLKLFRDNVAGFFIRKPLDKAEFDLSQSDKQVSASYLLATQEQGKADLAQTTFSQAQDYFKEAITQTIAAKKQGTDILEMTKKLEESNRKHVQILQAIEYQVSPKDKKKFQPERERAKSLAQMAKVLHSY